MDHFRWSVERGLKLSSASDGSPSIEELLRQARNSNAYKDLTQEEFLIKAVASLYNQIGDSKEKSPDKAKSDANSVVIDKEWVFEGIQDAYIYRHKGKNYYCREKDPKTNRWLNGFSLKCDTNRDQAKFNAQKEYTERASKRARGILNKSINSKQLLDLYLLHEAKRINKNTRRGITQESYDDKISRLGYWQRYIEDEGHKRRVIEDIPPILGNTFKDWIDRQPKERYTDTPRDVHTINRIVSATVGMYKWAKVNRYIGSDDTPNFKYMDVPSGYNESEDRDILWEEEYAELMKFMRYKYCTDKNKTRRDLKRRRQFSIYIRLHIATGMRKKELNNLRWNQITMPKHIKDERGRRINRDIFFPTSKNSKARTITSPIAILLDELIQLYKEVGAEIDTSSDSRVFFEIMSRSYRKDSWHTEKTIADWYDNLLIASGFDSKLRAEMPPRRITPNWARHYFATYKIVNDKWSYEEVALHLGNSKEETESRYSKATASMMRGKDMKNDGLNRIESYVFKAEDGKEIDKETQERLKDALIGLATDQE